MDGINRKIGAELFLDVREEKEDKGLEISGSGFVTIFWK